MNATRAISGVGRNQKERWEAIAREILTALCQTEVSYESCRRLCIEVNSAGIVLSGEVRMGWERDLAKVVAQLHNHGLPVFSHVRLYSPSTAPFADEAV